MSELITREAFKVIEGRPVTSSLKVAEYFGKLHKNVVRDIEELIAKRPDLRGLNFELTEEIKHLGATARKVPFYWMDRKGFAILAMGFTGAKALDFKCAFYDEFERMERELHPIECPANPKYITPQQGWIIQAAVQKRVHREGVDFQTVYQALKARYQIPKYTFLQEKDFEEALRFIDACEIRVPAKKAKLQSIPKPEPMLPPPQLSDEDLESLLIFIYTVRYLFADSFNKFYEFLKASKSPLAAECWDAFHEVSWGRILDILAANGHDIRDMPSFQRWKARHAA